MGYDAADVKREMGKRISELEAALRKVQALIIAASDETDPSEINGRLVEMAEAVRAVTDSGK